MSLLRLQRMLSRGSVAVLALALAVPAPAAGLVDLYRAALDHDSSLAAARAERAAGLEYRDIGLAGLLPSASVEYNNRPSHYGIQMNNAPTLQKYSYDMQTVNFQLTQPLFSLDRWDSYREGKVRAELAQLSYVDALQQLGLKLAQAWFDYLYAADSLELSRAQQAAYAEQQRQAEHMFKGGSATITDVEESRARKKMAESQVSAAVAAVAQKRRELESMTGPLPAGVEGGVGALRPEPPSPDDIQAWLGQARVGNLKVQAQQLNVRLADLETDRQRAGLMPELSLSAVYQRNREPNYYSGNDRTAQLGLSLSIPLYTGGRVDAQSRQAAFTATKTREELESARRDAEVAASEAYLGVNSALAQSAALEQAVAATGITITGMKAGQKAGLRTNSDVLNAQQQYYGTKRDLQRARYDYLLARLKLKVAVGSLEAGDIEYIDHLARAAP